MLAWSEARHASWADAGREAENRSASDGHLPQIRGQLRYHLGQMALVQATRAVNAGCIPFRTKPPGGIFMVARIGRFALVSLTVRETWMLPRRSLTRKMLSQPNESLDPELRLFEDRVSLGRGITELAYFGCLTTVPNKRDPSVPSELAFAVPKADLSGWICWIPFPRLHAMLQERVDASPQEEPDTGPIPDMAFPRFRLPKQRKDTGDDGEDV
jgi:hypothetical protein